MDYGVVRLPHGAPRVVLSAMEFHLIHDGMHTLTRRRAVYHYCALGLMVHPPALHKYTLGN